MNISRHVVLALFLLVGCGKKDKPAEQSATEQPSAKVAAGATATATAPAAAAGAASCLNPDGSICTDYADAAIAKSQCDLISGKLANTSCATTSKLGGCTLANHKHLTYYPGTDTIDAAFAKGDCTSMSGTWEP